jgi:hypothetical protein
VGAMDFDFLLFAKVGAAVVIHAGFLYFIFRQLDKLLEVKS